MIDRYTKAALAALGLALLALVRERAYRRGLENGYGRGCRFRTLGP